TNYTLVYNGDDFSITKKTITVTADAGQTKVYGAVNPALTFQYSGWVNGVETIDTAPSISTTVDGTTNVGVHTGAITLSGGLDNNYTFNLVAGDFTVTKAVLTATADNQTKVYGAVDPTLTYTITGFVNGDDEADLDTPVAIARVAGEDVGNYTITPSAAADANYAVSFVTSDLTINQLPIIVSANAGQEKVYGAVNPVYSYTSNPPVGTVLANGHLIGFSGAQVRVAGEDVNTYAITQGTLDNTNYDISYTGGSFSITPLAVTVTAQAKTKIYGETDPALTFVSSPTVGSALPNSLTISFTGDLSRAIGQDVGTYLISQNTVVNSNYTITYVPANFEITQRPITVKADAKTKVYGSTDPALTYQITVGGLAYSDTFTGALTRVAGETVLGSPYAINQGSLALSTNYTLTYQSANLIITTAPVISSVTVSPTTVQYSDQVTFTARIVGGAPIVIGGPQAAASVSFKVGTQLMNAIPIAFTVIGSDLVATGTFSLLEPIPFGTLPTGQMAPGSKTVTAVINSPDSNFAISPTNPTTSLTITKEDALVDYTGDVIKATASTSTYEALMTLRANIIDYADGYPGDIRNAKVRFVDRDNSDNPLSDWLPVTTLVNGLPDTSIGTVSQTITVDGLSSATPYKFMRIGIIVGDNGYYIRNSADDDVVITVYVPNGDFITGGGHIIARQETAGTMKVDVGSKVNFGFNVKYKNKKNIGGNMNIILRRTEPDGKVHNYQVTANAMASLGVNASVPSSQTAEYLAKANIKDVSGFGTSYFSSGNKDLYVKITDNGEPGKNDLISFVLVELGADPTVLGNVLFSSNWVNSKTEKMNLTGGNLVVHSGFNIVAPALNTTSVKVAQPEVAAELSLFNVIAYPNPSADYFMLKLQGVQNEEKIDVNVFDLLGRQVYSKQGSAQESYEFGQQFQVGVYLVTVKQGNN
ncbi:MAG: T9SS type A sorting domain-containing protein, partial [Gelidibacter sp.]|nr:T9SS type A sorting domain-containing protein [Gelidibacter sp.]